MGLGASIVVFAVGAVLSFAISVSESHGVNWNTVGNILMGVGAFGALVSILLLTTGRWGRGPWGPGPGPRRRRTSVVQTPGGVIRREDVDMPL